MNEVARPWIGLCFKLMAVLAFLFAFIFFMKMQEEQSENDKLRSDGVVSRALVVAKEKDELVTTSSSGVRNRSTTTTKSDLWVLTVRHVPKSTVNYADFPTKVKEAELPVAPALTGDPTKDSGNGGVMFVSQDRYDQTKVGDLLTVVNTPWDSTEPVLVSEVEAFDPSVFYPRMGIALFLTVVFWLIGRRISKASMLRGIVEASKVTGPLP